MNVEVKIGNIADSKDDIIVNAANRMLQEGAGVCWAIFDKANDYRLKVECNAIIEKNGVLNEGEIAVTKGYNTNAKYIIHAVGSIWRGGYNNERTSLYNCYVNSLSKAKELKCHSISFPAISTGIFGFPKEDAWFIAMKAVNDWLNKNAGYKIKVTFYVTKEESRRLAYKIMENI